MRTNTEKESCEEQIKKASIIKLGLDVHADSVSVGRQVEGAVPQPVQKFTWEGFWRWIAKQVKMGEKVYSCYEAGPFGYVLHRRLLGMGITNIVVRPQNWDELGKGVKTDKSDALALVQRLDRYVGGNSKALAVVCVPTLEQELVRSQSRLREQMRKHRQEAEAQGRSMMLYYGVRIKGRWWGVKRWAQIAQTLPEALKAMVESFAKMAQEMDKAVREITSEIEKASAVERPKGCGGLTSEVLRREVVDWNRFGNRRQIASITGLCPRVHASGSKQAQGSISKHGNPRLRRALVELAWRVCRYQPGYEPVKRRLALLAGPSAALRKKAVVAIARHLAIDLWRINTGRAKAGDLGLILAH
jgi:transposase